MSKELDILHNLEAKKELIKRTVCKNATDDELDLFIHICKRTRLDPFAKQIYAIKRGGVMTYQTGIDGYRLIAERTGKYMPGKEASFTYKDGKLFSATSYIKKLGPDGSWHEIAATAIYDEYVVSNNSIWKDKPHIMLAKCSETLVLRRAFPADMAGVNTDEEMEAAKAIAVDESSGEIIEIDEEKISYLEKLIDMSHTIDPTGELVKMYVDKIRKKEDIESYAKKCCDDFDRFKEFFTKHLAEKKVEVHG